MVAAGPLAHRRAAELAAPEDQRVVEHARAASRSLTRAAQAWSTSRGGDGHGLLDVAVVVPGAVVELDEPDAALGQPAGQQAVRGEAAVAGLLDAVEVEDALAARCRSRSARAPRPASGTPARTGRSGSGSRGRAGLRRASPLSRLTSSTTCRCVLWQTPSGIADVVDGVAPATGTGCPGTCWAGSPPTTAGPRPAAGPTCPAEVKHDEAGQVVGLGPQPVEQPRAHARPALDDRAGVHEGMRRVVVDLLGRIERMMQMSSAMPAMCGNRSEISWPDWPCLWNSHDGPRALSTVFCSWASCCPLVNDSGNGLPSSSLQLGLVVEGSRTATARRPCRGGSPAWP